MGCIAPLQPFGWTKSEQNTMQKLTCAVFFLFFSFLGHTQAQHTLRGLVSDQNGTPLEGANVWLPEAAKGSASDSSGQFALQGLAPGSYTLEVSYLGYATQRQIVKVPQQGELRIALEAFFYQVDALVVQGTRASRQMPMTFLNLDKKELQVNNLGQDLPFLLQWTPSVVVTSDAGTGIGYTGIRIRGTDPTRINITINGIPLNDAESQAVYWVNMPDFSSSISDIQIQRGVGSSTNGAGAFGATINLNTSRVNHAPYAGLNTTVGSFRTWKSNAEFGTGLLKGHFTLDGRLSHIRSNGYIDRASADLDAYYLSGAYVGKNSLLRFNLFSGHEVTYQAWYGVPANLKDDWDTRTFNPAGTEKEGDPYDQEEDNYRQTHYQLLYNQQINPFWNVNAALHYTKGGGYYEQYKADQDFSDYGLLPILLNGEALQTDLVRRRWLDNDFYGGVYHLNYSRDGLDLTVGGGVHRYEGAHFGELIWMQYASNSQPRDRYYDNEGKKTDANLYAKALFPIAPHWSAYGDLQLRQVNYAFLGYDEKGNNVQQQDQLRFFNPKAGVTFAPDARQSAYLSFAVGQREPNRDDYVESSPSTRPRPEKLYNTELGYRLENPHSALEITAYHMYYRDQLALNGQINDVGSYTRVNVDRSYRIGLEAAALWRPAHAWTLQANAALSRNKIVQFEEFLDDYRSNPQTGESTWSGQVPVARNQTDLSFSPTLVAGLECSVQPLRTALGKKEFEISWMTRYVSRQYIDNASDPNNVIDAYSFSNLRLRYRALPRPWGTLELTFLLQNLLNAQYESNAWSYRYRYDGETYVDQGFFPQAGRNYLLGFSLRW